MVPLVQVRVVVVVVVAAVGLAPTHIGTVFSVSLCRESVNLTTIDVVVGSTFVPTTLVSSMLA